MSRPPDTLSKEDIQTLHNVKRDLWIEGYYGMALGSVSGLILHGACRWLGRYRKLAFKLNRNTALAWFLGGGAFGALVLSTVRGKNIVHELHPIFRRGAKEPHEILDDVGEPKQQDILDQERNRLYRRTSIQVRKTIASLSFELAKPSLTLCVP